MNFLKFFGAVLAIAFVVGVFSFEFNRANQASRLPAAVAAAESNEVTHETLDRANQLYRLDASQSKFIAHALSGGLLWFKGHDHLVAVREFTGEAQFDPDSMAASSLQITAKAASMEETSSVFTEPQKQIINKELREIVLLPEQYPDIVFKSTNVTGRGVGNNQYDLKIAGDLTLHGVTRPATILTRVTVAGDQLRAEGEFSIHRSDFKVKATSAMHGLIRVRDKVKFTFDIVGHRY